MAGLPEAGIVVIAITIAFYGWGVLTRKLVGRALRWTNSAEAAVDHATLGVAGLLAVGGALNAAGLLYRPVYLGLFAIGLMTAAIALSTRWDRIDRRQLLVIIAAAAVALP